MRYFEMIRIPKVPDPNPPKDPEPEDQPQAKAKAAIDKARERNLKAAQTYYDKMRTNDEDERKAERRLQKSRQPLLRS
jgi:hypothetical protein